MNIRILLESTPFTFTCTYIKPHFRDLDVVIYSDVLIFAVPSGPPQNLTLQANNSRTLMLEWEIPLPQHVNGIVTGFTIYISSHLRNSTLLVQSNDTTYIITSLRPHVAYTCMIAAHTSVGIGPFSSGITLTTPEDAPEASPLMLSYSNVLSRSVDLTWMAPRADRHNGIIRYYIIEAYENDTGSVLTYQTLSNQMSFVVSGLHPYYTYSIWIRAVTVSPGPQSTAITVNTPQDSKLNWMHSRGNTLVLSKGIHILVTLHRLLFCFCILYSSLALDLVCAHYFILLSSLVPTAAPQMPSGFPLTSTLLRLTWSPPPAEDINGVITFYLVEVTEVISGTRWIFHAVQTSINVGPLHPYYNYQCRVTAFTIGAGPFTSFFYVTTGETSRCCNFACVGHKTSYPYHNSGVEIRFIGPFLSCIQARQ